MMSRSDWLFSSTDGRECFKPEVLPFFSQTSLLSSLLGRPVTIPAGHRSEAFLSRAMPGQLALFCP